MSSTGQTRALSTATFHARSSHGSTAARRDSWTCLPGPDCFWTVRKNSWWSFASLTLWRAWCSQTPCCLTENKQAAARTTTPSGGFALNSTTVTDAPSLGGRLLFHLRRVWTLSGQDANSILDLQLLSSTGVGWWSS